MRVPLLTVFAILATPVGAAPQSPVPSPLIRIQAQPPATPAPDATREAMLQRLMAFVADDYLGTGRDDHENSPDLYAPVVAYYGRQQTSRAGVMAGKRAYYAKWPSRRYEMIPGTLQAKPGADDSVEITFRYTYEVGNGRRSARGIGSTTLGLILLDDGRYQIVKEAGGVIRRTGGS